MYFEILEPNTRPPTDTGDRFFLVRDRWDDWFTYETQFHLNYVNNKNEAVFIGNVKIGQFSMEEGQKSPDITGPFEELSDKFFSLGQEEEYYQNLNNLGEEIRNEVLTRLKDVALDQHLYEKAISEDVMNTSLLRSVARSSVKGRFKKLARGDASLTSYEFKYRLPLKEDTILSFKVEPNSTPPTNIHTIIGRNGVGKTHLLNNIVKSVLLGDESFGKFINEEELLIYELFANMVFVSFSAFESSIPVSQEDQEDFSISYSYIGLKDLNKNEEKGNHLTKDTEILRAEFVESLLNCVYSAKRRRWQEAVDILQSDPIFRHTGITQIPYISDKNELESYASILFDKLSSGHKIVLLTITRLVETVEEKSLVMLDEPEAHLHPPLLSAFTRALSNLLITRNGVAIVATHSPVVLQEVPRSCVWKVRRAREEVVAERLEIESFGENIGSLTREVFGLEVTHSGFHTLIMDAVQYYQDYDEIVAHFNNELGKEALFLIRSLLMDYESRE
ncbi:AAA family ATPase [Halobacillus litoralis]|uniref:AAA family ATPase n=1 Tax=Halobacillus litoralis TaxID=45668 RepID=UPI001CD5647C|nr:AAA family ATPase [Halobacillus litoralis]MCA1021829.1 ATP-binding protein [Halobacillus litoralis]